MSIPGEGTSLAIARRKSTKRFGIALAIMIVAALLFFILGLFVGNSTLSFTEAIKALFGDGTPSAVRIMQRIRLPRAIAAMLVGGGLGLAGLMMQTSLANPMASPGTLGISNAAVLGANIAIICMTDNPVNGTVWNNPNPYGVAGIAFLSAMIATFLVLLLSKIRNFSPVSIVLIGIGLGAAYQAITTLVQYFAAEHTLASAVYWSFGDIGRINPTDNILLLVVAAIAFIAMMILSNRYDAFLLGEKNASTLGVNVELLRFICLFLASLLTASIVSLCGIIGFVGIVAPHICRRIVGQSHRRLVPTTLLIGAVLVASSDVIGRLFAGGAALPVGAVTALFGAPFFIILMLTEKGARR